MADDSDQPAAEPTDPGQPPTSVGPLLECPKCKEKMPAEAVLCVHCGFNVRTGAVAGTAGTEPEEAPGRQVAIPVRGIVVVAVVVVVLGAAWLFIAKPLVDGLRVSYAVSHLTDGSLQKARQRFEELKAKVGAAARRRCELRIRQIDLEAEHNRGETMSQGIEVSIGTADMAVADARRADEALVYTLTVENRGDAPLTLQRAFFYIRGSNDITLPSPHKESSVDGLVVPPGESREAVVVFHGKPMRPAMVRVGTIPVPCFYLFLNDGATYCKRLLPP